MSVSSNFVITSLTDIIIVIVLVIFLGVIIRFGMNRRNPRKVLITNTIVMCMFLLVIISFILLTYIII